MSKFGDYKYVVMYLVGILVLMTLPVPAPKFQLAGIGSDKWAHIALFAGLGILFRATFRFRKQPSMLALCFAAAAALLAETAQAIIGGRNAEIDDFLAGLVGAVLGIIIMVRVLKASSPFRVIGILVIIIGCALVSLSVLADMLGMGTRKGFGYHQIIGTIVGFIAILGGGRMYLMRLESK